jgi:hypothetical protein
MPRLVTLVAVLAALCVALVPAGCGGDDRGDEFSSALGGEGEQDADTLGKYLQRISDVAGAYETILATPETESDATFQRLGEDLAAQKQRLAVLDRRLQVAMKDVLPADDYKQLQERMRDLQDKFDEAANGG